MKNRTFTIKAGRSTVLLFCILVFTLMCVSSFVISVNSRYAQGMYTSVFGDKEKYVRLPVFPAKNIALDGIADCMVIASDSLKVEVPREDANAYRVEAAGDSIRISTSVATGNRVLLYLPTDSRLVVTQGSVLLRGSDDRLSPLTYDVQLVDSKLIAGTGDHTFVHQLSIAGMGNAAAEVRKYFHIQSLNINNVGTVDLSQSWQIGALTTRYDGRPLEMTKVRDSVSVRVK